MKTALPVLTGLVLITAVAVARHREIDQPPLIHIPKGVHHQYMPLTPAQKNSAAQLFRLKSSPSNGTPPIYTLTPQTPFSGPLSAALSAMGVWDTDPNINQITLGASIQAPWAQVYMTSLNPAASYIVTFNITVSGQSQLFYEQSIILTTTTASTNPLSPSVTLPPGSYSVPIMLPPTYNLASLSGPFTPNGVVFLDSVTIQQY